MGNGKSSDKVEDVPSKPPDVNWNGNLKKHKYTDLICLIIFLIFLFTWAVIGVVSILKGDINKVSILNAMNTLH